MRSFPLEKARIQVFIIPLYFGIAAILCWGWALERNAPLAAPLVLSFIIGLCLTGSFNGKSLSRSRFALLQLLFRVARHGAATGHPQHLWHDSNVIFERDLLTAKSRKVMSTMLVDLYPLSPATATAANNLVRCLVGAAGTAVIIQMINGMGRGWCFTFIAAVIFVTSPLLWVELKWGPKWREQRRVRVEKAGGREGGKKGKR